MVLLIACYLLCDVLVLHRDCIETLIESEPQILVRRCLFHKYMTASVKLFLLAAAPNKQRRLGQSL